MRALRFLCFFCIGLFCCTLSLGQLDPRDKYATYLGGSRNDCFDVDSVGNCGPNLGGHNYGPASTYVTAVTVDNAGNVYVAGSTDAIDFPTTLGAYHRKVHYAGNRFGELVSDDTFVAKFNPNGTLVWSTYLGIAPGLFIGRGSPPAVAGIALDLLGNIYIGGTVLQQADISAFSPFALKLKASGSQLLYLRQFYVPMPNTCGDGSGEIGTGLATDPAGNAYFTGEDHWNCFAATQSANSSGSGFVMKLNPTGATMYVARVGFPGDKNAQQAIATDSSGNAYVTGPAPAEGTPSLAFVEKLNSIGTLAYSTELLNPDASAAGYGAAIKVTAAGHAIVVGTTNTIAATSTFCNDFGGSQTYIVELNSGGNIANAVYTAAIADPQMAPMGLALDSAHEPFVVGEELGTAPCSVNRYRNAPGSGGFLVRLKNTGKALWLDSTYGGAQAFAVAVDSMWNAWVVGTANANSFFPLTPNAYQSSFKGAKIQGTIAKLIIEADLKMLIQGASPNPVKPGTNLTYTLAVFNNGPDVSDGDTVTDVLPSGTTFVSFSNTNGTCTHPGVGSGGTFKCTRSSPLLKGHYWGPVQLTVLVNAASGTTLTNKASVAAKTQDVVPSNNTASVSVNVQ